MDWATADVTSLLTVAAKQTGALSSCLNRLETAEQESTRFTQFLPSMNLKTGIPCRGNLRGMEIRRLEQRTHTKIYTENRIGEERWMIYYPDKTSLSQNPSTK